MALSNQDKKWIVEAVAESTKHLATKEDLKGLATRDDLAVSEERTDKKLSTLREEMKEMFKLQNEFFSNALRNQTHEIIAGTPSREEPSSRSGRQN